MERIGVTSIIKHDVPGFFAKSLIDFLGGYVNGKATVDTVLDVAASFHHEGMKPSPVTVFESEAAKLKGIIDREITPRIDQDPHLWIVDENPNELMLAAKSLMERGLIDPAALSRITIIVPNIEHSPIRTIKVSEEAEMEVASVRLDQNPYPNKE